MITKVFQIFDDESGNQTIDKTTTTLVFRVVVDSPGANDDIYGASDGITTIPPVNSVVKGFRIASKDLKRDADNPLFFVVTCHLDSSLPELEKKPTGKEKLNCDIEVNVEPYEEPIHMDFQNRAIVNTAGFPYANQPSKTYYDEKLTIDFTTGEVDQANIDKCRGSINSDTVNMTVKGYPRTFKPKTLRLIDTPIKSKVIDGEYNWNVRYVLAYRKDTWVRKIPSMGRTQLIAGEPRPVRFKNTPPGGNTEDAHLDQNGKQAIVGSGVVELKLDTDPATAPGDPVYQEFQFDPDVSFAGLLSGIQ